MVPPTRLGVVPRTAPGWPVVPAPVRERPVPLPGKPGPPVAVQSGCPARSNSAWPDPWLRGGQGVPREIIHYAQGSAPGPPCVHGHFLWHYPDPGAFGGRLTARGVSPDDRRFADDGRARFHAPLSR